MSAEQASVTEPPSERDPRANVQRGDATTCVGSYCQMRGSICAAMRAMPRDAARGAHPDVLSIAPMMDWTTRHYRFLVRLMTRCCRLYTEMIVDKTLKHSKIAPCYLWFHELEHPIACQLGGSCPEDLAAVSKDVEAAGYDEINLNCGCPSDKVAGKGCFGAALMRTPELVRDCVATMRAAVSIPITVKCRLGVDDMDSYEAFSNFVRVVSASGCTHFVIHARKCLLHGLSPKDNRKIPPLRYHWVQRVAMDFPHLRFSVNGGVNTLEEAAALLLLRRGRPLDAADALWAGMGAEAHPGAFAADGYPVAHMQQLHESCSRAPSFKDMPPGSIDAVLDSVMIGRAAYNNPWMLADVDRFIFGKPNPIGSRRELLTKYMDYIEGVMASVPAEMLGKGVYRAVEAGKPLMGLFFGEPGGARFRATLTSALVERKIHLPEALAESLVHISDATLDSPPGVPPAAP